MTSRGKDCRRKGQFYILIPLFFWLFEQVALHFPFALGHANSEPVLSAGRAVVTGLGREWESSLSPALRNAFLTASRPSLGDVHPQATHTFNGGPAGSKAETKSQRRGPRPGNQE